MQLKADKYKKCELLLSKNEVLYLLELLEQDKYNSSNLQKNFDLRVDFSTLLETDFKGGGK